MDYLNSPSSDLQDSAVKVLIGFFGTIAAIFLLPRTIKFLIRNFLFSILGEVVTVVIAGLLTEKAVEKLGKH